MRCVKPAHRGLLALALVAGSLFAQSADPDLQRIRGDIARLKQRLADVRKQAQSVEAEVEAADLELGIRTRELDITLETHARLERERAGIAAQIADLIPRIERQKWSTSPSISGRSIMIWLSNRSPGSGRRGAW